VERSSEKYLKKCDEHGMNRFLFGIDYKRQRPKPNQRREQEIR
jgi:hypothetical protein